MILRSKILFSFILFISFLGGFSQNEPIPKFLLTNKDTAGYLICSKGELDTFILLAKKNIKYCVQNDIKCSAKIFFTVTPDFGTSIRSTNVIVNCVFPDKITNENYKKIVIDYYTSEAQSITHKTAGLWTPKRKKGKYIETPVNLEIDFTNSEKKDSTKIDFPDIEYTNNTLGNQKLLLNYAHKYLYQKKISLSLRYFYAYPESQKNPDILIEMGNVWDIYDNGSTTACEFWQDAAKIGSEKAKEIVSKKCLSKN